MDISKANKGSSLTSKSKKTLYQKTGIFPTITQIKKKIRKILPISSEHLENIQPENISEWLNPQNQTLRSSSLFSTEDSTIQLITSKVPRKSSFVKRASLYLNPKVLLIIKSFRCPKEILSTRPRWNSHPLNLHQWKSRCHIQNQGRPIQVQCQTSLLRFPSKNEWALHYLCIYCLNCWLCHSHCWSPEWKKSYHSRSSSS